MDWMRILATCMAAVLAGCSAAPQVEKLFLAQAVDVAPDPALATVADPWPVPGERPIGETFECAPGVSCTLDRVLRETRACALLVVQHGRLVHEYYESANRNCREVDGGKPNGPAKLFDLASITQSMTSSLLGYVVAHPDRFGWVQLDDPVSWHVTGLPLGTHLHTVPLRHVLTMTSALRYDERNRDLARLNADSSGPGGKTFLQVASVFSARDGTREPGRSFHHSALDATLLGLVVEAALARSADGPAHINDALAQWLWRPAGARSTGRWQTDRNGMPNPSCCAYMTARDLARVGQYLLANWHGQQSDATPLHDWIRQAGVQQSAAAGQTCRIQGRDEPLGYGFQWWTLGGRNGFAGIGTGGQFLHLFPEQHTVVVQFGSWRHWSDDIACSVHAAHRMLADRNWP